MQITTIIKCVTYEYEITSKCINYIYNARQNAQSMLRARGFHVENSIFLMDDNRLKILYNIYLTAKNSRIYFRGPYRR